MLKSLFGSNASEEERVKELRKLNDALHRRAKKYLDEHEFHLPKVQSCRPE